MKKILALLLVALSLSSYADYELKSFRRFYLDSSGSSQSQDYAIVDPQLDADSIIFPIIYNNSIFFKVNSSNGALSQPSQSTSFSSSISLSRPITVVSNDVVRYAPLSFLAPRCYSLYLFCNAYYRVNPHSSVFNSFSSGVSFFPRDVIQEIFLSTNSLIVSSFLNEIKSINSLVDENGYMLSDILDNISGFVGPLKSKPFTEQIDAYAKLSGSYVGGIPPGELQSIKDTYHSLADSDTLAAARYADSVLSGLRQASDFIALNKALSQIGPTAFDAVSGVGSQFNQGLQNSVDSGFSSSAHIQGATTNILQRMSTNWVQETKAALSNNTQKIKDDLAAWKNQLHGTQTSIDNSTANINNTLNNIAGGSSVVRVNVQNQDIGVTITDPVTIDPTQFNSFSEDLGKAGEYMERLYNEFKYWAWQSPDGWQTGFLDSFLHTLLPKVEQEVSVQHSISNLLSEFALNYTNNAQFAISNALASFSFSSTNDYLLLSDYQSFIDSSKYNEVVSSLPDDLAAALSSFGFSDSSEYSGRWWVFQSANMALQSQLALTNAALSSTLLNALSAIDDSDDSGGSLLSRWLSLIDSIPDPEEIQQSLADATNIVSNIGFERADALYATATQDLVSVVKGIYQDKSLPDHIRFVFIPASEGRDEKYVDIPVGEHSSLWSLFRSGMAFALSVVTLILFPKYVSWLVFHYTRLVERIIKSLHAYTHQ